MNETEKQLWIDHKIEPTTETRNHLMELYLGQVKHHAWKLYQRMPKSVDFADLISAGTFGLMGAIESFDPSLDIKFETFAAMRIRGSILDDLRNKSWVPRLASTQRLQYDKAHESLQASLGRPPSHQELAERLGITEAKVARIEAQRVNTCSLAEPISNSNRGDSTASLIRDRSVFDPAQGIQKSDVARMIVRGLGELERKIVLMYYYDELTMKEVGEVLGISESRVSQIHTHLVERLRDKLRDRLDEFEPV